MFVLVPNLHKDRASVSQQIPCHRKPIPQIGQVRMNSVSPGISERPHLFRLAGYVLKIAILDIATGR